MATGSGHNEEKQIVLRQQEDFIRRMKYEGTLDVYFDTVAELRSPESPGFLVEMTDLYLAESPALVARLEREINQPIPLHEAVMKDLFQFRSSSASMGGGRLAAACLDFKHAYDHDKLRCFESFAKLKHEYETFRDALAAIGQMERRILSHGGDAVAGPPPSPADGSVMDLDLDLDLDLDPLIQLEQSSAHPHHETAIYNKQTL